MEQCVLIKSSEGYERYTAEDLLSLKRVIWIDEMVDKQVAVNVVNKMLYMDLDNHKPITLLIDSPGGDIQEGLMIYDVMKIVKSPVQTIAIGDAASMGAVLLAAGEKGRRFVFPSARVMIHEPLLSQINGKNVSEVIEIGETMRNVKSKINQILSRCTGKSIEEIDTDTKKDCFFDAKEAVEYGLADGIMDKKLLQELFE